MTKVGAERGLGQLKSWMKRGEHNVKIEEIWSIRISSWRNGQMTHLSQTLTSNVQSCRSSKLNPTVQQSLTGWTNLECTSALMHHAVIFLHNVLVQIVKCICLNCQMYVSKLLNIFVQRICNTNLECTSTLMHRAVIFLQNVLVQIVKCICPNC